VTLAARLREATAGAWRDLDAAGVVHPSAIRTEPGMPRALERVVQRAMERVGGAEAEQLASYYAEIMPRQRVEQLGRAGGDGAALLHAALDWDRLPRMRAAISSLARVLGEAGVDASGVHSALRAGSLAELYCATYYGGCMPLLYGCPADLAYFASRGLDVQAAIDRYLTVPVLHELCHLGRDRDALPPHLDECVAGWLGVHVWPEFAYPEPGQDDAIYASPWLSQIGAAMVRAFGLSPVLRAHGGDRGALPATFVAAAEAAYWHDWEARRPLHFLSDTLAPRPWIELVLAHAELRADADADRRIVEDALRAMCLVTERVGGSFRTRSAVPDAPIVVECGVVSTRAKNELDIVPPSYWIPSTVPVTARIELRLMSLEDIPAAAATLVPSGQAWRASSS